MTNKQKIKMITGYLRLENKAEKWKGFVDALSKAGLLIFHVEITVLQND